MNEKLKKAPGLLMGFVVGVALVLVLVWIFSDERKTLGRVNLYHYSDGRLAIPRDGFEKYEWKHGGGMSTIDTVLLVRHYKAPAASVDHSDQYVESIDTLAKEKRLPDYWLGEAYWIVTRACTTWTPYARFTEEEKKKLLDCGVGK